jgi:hypothetical protein
MESSSISEGLKQELRQDFDELTESFDRVDRPDDACIGGIRRHAGGRRDIRSSSNEDGDFSALMTGVVKDIEEFVRRYPWPTLLIGFALGYLLSKSREK